MGIENFHSTAFASAVSLPGICRWTLPSRNRITLSASSAPPRQIRRQRERELQRKERKKRAGLGFGVSNPHEIENRRRHYPDHVNGHDDDGPMLAHVLNCIVKIYCTHGPPNYSMPWAMQRQKQSTSSGFIMSNRRIITCAHCVEHHTVVMVKRRGSDAKYPARVVAIGNECDTAWLGVDDEAFWSDAEHIAAATNRPSYLTPGQLPNLQDVCTVVGYPSPGENISITQGVCSRIEMQGYAHSTSNLLAVQLDAAINGGNSGGPVLNERWECVGIAFQSIDPAEADSIGYFIPHDVVQHFLDDIYMHRHYTGFPDTGFFFQKMENEGMRRALNLPEEEDGNGILLKSVNATTDAARVLRSGDIVTHLDGIAVSNAGTVPFEAQKGERISLSYLITARFVNDEVNVTFYRDGTRHEEKYRLPAIGESSLVPCHIQRQYVVHGGLVFLTLSEPYLRSEYNGDDFLTQAPVSFIQKYAYGQRQNDGVSEVVVLAQVLNSTINSGYEDFGAQILNKLNGEVIKSLTHLAELLDRSEADDNIEWLRFELENDEVIILDKQKAAAENKDILQTHCISQSRLLPSHA